MYKFIIFKTIFFLKGSTLWIHPLHDSFAHMNDIAMLQLATPFQFTSGVQSIAFDTRLRATEMECMLVGWGRTNGILISISFTSIPTCTCRHNKLFTGLYFKEITLL